MASLLHSCTCRVLWLMMRLVSLPVYVCILLNEKGREGKKENYRQIDNSSLRVLFLLFFSFSSSSFSSLLCSCCCCSLSLQFTVNEEREHFRCCCCFHYSNWIRTEYRQTHTLNAASGRLRQTIRVSNQCGSCAAAAVFL